LGYYSNNKMNKALIY